MGYLGRECAGCGSNHKEVYEKFTAIPGKTSNIKYSMGHFVTDNVTYWCKECLDNEKENKNAII
jgi:hypothetical protein